MFRIVVPLIVAGLVGTGVGCQSTQSLFGKKELPKDLQIAEAKISPENVPAATTGVADLIDRADRDLAGQRYAAAKQNYEQVLRQQPTNAHAHHRLAVIADIQERFADAEKHYQAAIAVDGRNSQILSDFGYSYILQSRLDDAEIRLNQARAADPSNLNAAANLALLYAHRGDREKCLAVARLLGSPESADQTVDSLFEQAAQATGRPVPSNPESKIQLAGALDFLKRDKSDQETRPGEVNDFTRDLAAKMEAAREASIRERTGRAGYDPRQQLPSTREILSNGSTSPDHLVDALAEIDRTAPTANALPPLQADPRIRGMQQGFVSTPPNGAWPQNVQQGQSPQSYPQQSGLQQPQQFASQSSAPAGYNGPTNPRPQQGLVTADHVEGYVSGPGVPTAGSNVIGTNGYAEPKAAAWPTGANPPQPQQTAANPFAAPPGFSGQPQMPMAAPQNAPAVQAAPPGYGAVNGIPQTDPMTGDAEAARQKAAALGMGAGLGGMFDRYAYKQAMESQYGAGNGQPGGMPQSGAMPASQTQWPPQPNVPANSAGPANHSMTTPQQWPGTNSMYGAQYPQVERQLPTMPNPTPPAISVGMPTAPNWQGQMMPTSTPQLSGPGQYSTVTPTGAMAPTPPPSAFSAPVMNVQTLPQSDPTRDALNSDFNNLQRRMMGTPNYVPSQGYGQEQNNFGPTQTGPTNPNVPYYGQTTGPTAGGFSNSNRVNAAPPNVTLPPGFVQPPPYNGGQSVPTTPVESNRVTPQSTTQGFGGGNLPQIVPN